MITGRGVPGNRKCETAATTKKSQCRGVKHLQQSLQGNRRKREKKNLNNDYYYHKRNE